jgi:serine/threonine-protein kinase HipA
VRVLRNEAAYYRVAHWFGVRTGEALRFENDALFIPRFDRVVHAGGLERLGVESVASLAGVSEFGAATSQNTYCRALALFTTNPQQELLEFVRRDVLNVALGNTDNHGRNTAVIRYADNRVLLSPLYDFAPMILDPQGIARLARWEQEEALGQPLWEEVGVFLQTLGCESVAIVGLFAELAQTVPQLPQVMAACGVDEALIAQVQPRITAVSERLQAYKP